MIINPEVGLVAAVFASQLSRGGAGGLGPSPRLEGLLKVLAGAGQPASIEAPPEQTEHVTTTQAAKTLGCSERTVQRLAARLGGRKIGGRWLLDPVALAEHLEGTND